MNAAQFTLFNYILPPAALERFAGPEKNQELSRLSPAGASTGRASTCVYFPGSSIILALFTRFALFALVLGAKRIRLFIPC